MSRSLIVLTLFACLGHPAIAAEADLEDSISIIQQGASKQLDSSMKKVVAIGAPAVPRLLDLLEAKNPVVNESAMLALSEIFKTPSTMSGSSLDRLIKISRVDRELPARRAAHLLGKFADPKAAIALEENALNETLNPNARVAALQTLAAHKDKSKYRGLFERLKKSEVTLVRAQAIDSLATAGSKAELEDALELLKNSPPKSEEQRKALLALEKMGDARAIPALQKFIDEGHGDARARRAVARIEFSQAKNDDERIKLLRKGFRSPGVVGDWAADEVALRKRQNPKFGQILEEAASDPNHPRSAHSKAILERSRK